ncbi:MAG: T9SS C-terminal target domain-containing protein [Bacteroidetes bacterium]|nr:MAG: T9SS C-terminal target domain-containing protein [Bacteroidota bacterium]
MKTIINTLKAIILIAGIIALSCIKGWGANPVQPQRAGAVGFSIGSKGYIGMGYGYTYQNQTCKKDFWEYNPATDSWTQKADFGGGLRANAAFFALNNKGYVGTGQSSTQLFKDFWEYNPATNKWTRKADFGGVTRKCATGFAISSGNINKGYIGTGLLPNGTTPINLQDLWEYDPAANSWSQKTDFPGTPRYAAVSFSTGGKGYLGTGINFVSTTEMTWYQDFYEYDPISNLWTRKSDFPGTERAFAAGFSIGSMGYIGTGSSHRPYYSDFWEYNPAENSWIQINDFASARDASVGFSIGTKGYIGTGGNGIDAASYLADFWEYDQNTNAWTRKTDLGSKHKGPLKDGIINDENEPASNSELIVYPNPSSTTFNFNLKTSGKELVSIQIYDLLGRLVSEYKSLPPGNIMTIGEDLYAGIYIAVVTQGEYRKSVKINKVK